MYYFGKDFVDETEIQSLLEDFLKQKQLKKDMQYYDVQKQQNWNTVIY